MTEPQPPRRTRALAAAAAAQTPWILAGTTLSGIGYVTAVLLSGRVVGTGDVAAIMAGSAITGWTALLVTWRMWRAGDRAVTDLAPRRTNSTRAMPAVERPDYTGDRAAADDARRATQARVDRAHSARHALGKQPPR